MAKHRDGTYYRKDRKSWYVSYMDADNKRKRVPAPDAKTWQEAQDFRAAKMLEAKQVRELKPGEIPPNHDTFSQVAERYLKHQKSRISGKSHERESGIMEHLKSFFGPDTKIASITPLQVSEFVSHRLGQVSKSSTRKELNVLRHLYRLCCGEWQLLPRFSNPTLDVQSPQFHDERSRFLTPDEFKRVLQASPEKVRPVFALLVGTGCRRGELLSCKWGYVGTDRITLPTSKNGRPRIIYLNAFSRSVLRSLPQGGPDDLLFPDLKPIYLSVTFHRVCQKLGIRDIRLHDLRHTHASWLRQNGVELDLVARQLGHASIRMSQRYAAITPGQVSQAVNGLDAILGTVPESEQMAKAPIASHRLVTADNKLLTAKSVVN